MTFINTEGKVTGIAVDTETDPAIPAWAKYRRFLFDMDGLVHRLKIVRALTVQVHDEAMLELEPWTGCGFPLHAFGKEAGDKPEAAGFRNEDEPLTCMVCASDRPAAGDVYAAMKKQLLFGALYGKSSNNVLMASGRMSGKSYSLKQVAAMHLGHKVHSYAEAYATQPLFPRKHRFSSSFMHMLATAVLPPEK